MADFGKDLWTLSGPTPLLSEGHLKQVVQMILLVTTFYCKCFVICGKQLNQGTIQMQT